MAVARGEARGRLCERVSAVVRGEGIEDFGLWENLVADGARARCERPPARAAMEAANDFELFRPGAFAGAAPAVAVRAAVGVFDWGRGGAGDADDVGRGDAARGGGALCGLVVGRRSRAGRRGEIGDEAMMCRLRAR